jgi:lipoprotein signal peptidase
MTNTVNHLSPKAKAFWPLLTLVLVADFISKRWAENRLVPLYTPHEVIGEFVRFTLAYNKYAAMGLSLGAYSRVGFGVIAAIVLVVLGVFYRKTPADSAGSAAALALVAGGALGNLTDRIMSAQGVVDFIDVGLGSARFYTFNVADAAITCGAILLALLSMKGNAGAEAAGAPAQS